MYFTISAFRIFFKFVALFISSPTFNETGSKIELLPLITLVYKI